MQLRYCLSDADADSNGDEVDDDGDHHYDATDGGNGGGGGYDSIIKMTRMAEAQGADHA